MSWWEAVLDSLGTLAVLAGLGLVALFVRRRWLSRLGGAFECSVRMRPPGRGGGPTASRGWMLGLARYRGDDLEWFRTFSFSPRPKHTFDRSMTVGARRTPNGAEAFSLYAGHLVVAIDLDSRRHIELAMSERALTGFLAWGEAAPPGRDRLLG
ncbi:MAG: DUF2550 domain-containing protein [Propionibacteriales bacterium]|nr:DUF2550 domain-containing protein [Propionibacteriales bacterium]